MSEAYTVSNLNDIPDMSGDNPGTMKMLKNPLGTEQVSLTHRVMPAGYGGMPGDPTAGHLHKTQEEVLLILRGRLSVKVGDEVVELGPSDAIRIAPGVSQAVRNNGPEEVELLMVSNRVADLRSEIEMLPGFWPLDS